MNLLQQKIFLDESVSLKSLMVAFLLVLCLWGYPSWSNAEFSPELPDAGTPLQQNHYRSIPTASEIDDYLQSLTDQTNDAISVQIGSTVQNRPLRAVLISTDPGFLTKGSTEGGKITVMLVGSQHPSEASGAEALQILAHELIRGGLHSLLKTMNLKTSVGHGIGGKSGSERPGIARREWP